MDALEFKTVPAIRFKASPNLEKYLREVDRTDGRPNFGLFDGAYFSSST